MKKLIVLIVGSMISLLTHANESPFMFTGPLLAPSGITIPAGHVNVEPYFFYIDNEGIYNRHWHVVHTSQSKTISINPLLVSYGINDFMDAQMSLPYNFIRANNQSANGLSDLNILLGFQIFKQSEHTKLPDFRITLGETFPTGTYKNLKPQKLGLDGAGFGSYATTITFNFQYLSKLFNHYLRKRVVITARPLNTRAKLSGITTYGGGIGTKGTIRPANQFSIVGSSELSVTKNWVAVFEAQYVYRTNTNFRGMPGIGANGMPLPIGHGTIDQITFSPALEYNFSSSLGLIAGAWFTIAGKDTAEFSSFVLAINYYI